MIVALAYCAKDRDQAERLAGWLVELGPFPRHSFLIFRHEACAPIAAFEKFAAGETVIHDDVFDSWPQSANHAFKKAAKHVEFTSRKPFLWLEPDAVPITSSSFDLIEAEYIRQNKPFLGDIINDGQGFVPHMSGIGVYPGSIANAAGEIYFASDTPWDVAAGSVILPQAAKSELIMHRWKAPLFESWEQFEKNVLSAKPKCELFHSDKSGSLIELLRARARGFNIPVESAPTQFPKAPQTPWENVDESYAEIRALAKRLRAFVNHHAPDRMRAYRRILHDEGVVKIPEYLRRRGKRIKQPRKTRTQKRDERRLIREHEERELYPDQDCLYCLKPRPVCKCVLAPKP